MSSRKKILSVFLFVYCLIANVNLAYAQTTQQYDYRNSGVQKQLEQYLCTPTENNTGSYVSQNGSYFGFGSDTGAGQSNKASGDLYLCINKLYRFAIVISSVLAVFFIIIAGYVYMSADGDSEAVNKAKNILVTSITGLVILFVGYILLKAINPDLIEFKNIQPPAVRFTATTAPTVQLYTDGTIKSISGGAGHTAAELQQAGCTLQTNPSKEVQYMTEQMFTIAKSICFNVKSAGSSAQISSIIGQGQHSADSYHYKGCAVDFADGGGDGYISRPGGVAVMNAAKAFGGEVRINPGTDANQTYHIHVDLGTKCPAQ